MRYASIGLMAAAALLATSQSAWARPCKAECPTVGPSKGTAVIPDERQFSARGDLFSTDFTELSLSGDGLAQIALPFQVNFGFGATSSLLVGENGLVRFGAGSAAQTRAAAASVSLTQPFVPVDDLSDLGFNVIAPFYADLMQPAGQAEGRLSAGDIVVQYGQADPYADDAGVYSMKELQDAVRISWYGVPVGSGAAAAARGASPAALFQLLITDDGEGTSSFEFRYGSTDDPTQPGYGSIAGFNLAGTQVQFNGPYGPGTPTFFEFLNGRYVGQFAEPNGAVPEPETWAEMIAGFALVGGIARARRRGSIRRLSAV